MSVSERRPLKNHFENIGFSDGDEIIVMIDGREVADPYIFRLDELSPLFDIEIPDDNILGVDTSTVGNTGQSVAGGYYIMLPPLSRGEHVIYFKGVLGESGLFPGFTQEVTYYLDVVTP